MAEEKPHKYAFPSNWKNLSDKELRGTIRAAINTKLLREHVLEYGSVPSFYDEYEDKIKGTPVQNKVDGVLLELFQDEKEPVASEALTFCINFKVKNTKEAVLNKLAELKPVLKKTSEIEDLRERSFFNHYVNSLGMAVVKLRITEGIPFLFDHITFLSRFDKATPLKKRGLFQVGINAHHLLEGWARNPAAFWLFTDTWRSGGLTPENVEVHFVQDKKTIGWIEFHIKIGEKALEINTSPVFPPYQDLISFLEKVISNDLPVSIDIDEEGHIKKYTALPLKNFTLCHLIIGNAIYLDRRYLEATVNRKHFVSEVFNKFTRFLSDGYNDKLWDEDPKKDLKKINLEKLKGLLEK